MIVSKKQMQDWCLPYGGHPDVEVVEDTITEHTRWSVHHVLIFKWHGKTYRTYYSRGATEYQDEGPWDEVEIECEEVRQVERIVKVWEPVGQIGEWTATPPTEPGYYWYWTGESCDKPRPLTVQMSGEKGYVRAVEMLCERIPGLWMRLSEPAIVTGAT